MSVKHFNVSDIVQILKNTTMIFILIVVMSLFQILITSSDKGSLFAPANITNIINQNAYVVILATGMLMCILTGGNIDLSVGSVVAFVGAMAGTLIVNMRLPISLSIVLCLLVGIAIGAWHGLWIAFVHIPPFIVTLSGMLLWRGLTLVVLNGLTISPLPENYLKVFSSYISVNDSMVYIVTMILTITCASIVLITQIISRISKNRKGYEVDSIIIFLLKLIVYCALIFAVGYLLAQDRGIPIVLIIISCIVGFYTYFTKNTIAGRNIYAIGGNERAARLSGVSTDKVMFFVYTNMGFLSAVAGLICVARFNSATPTVGQNYEMDAIASCFIGGASAYGGTGTVGGAVVGAVFMGMLNNAMSILSIDANWQRAMKGLLLLVAVVFDVIFKNRRTKR